jgi:hypothetical protein
VRKKIVRSHAPVEQDEIESFRMPRRRERRESFMKTVLAGRGHEFGGVALICFGILLSMSIYVEFAGPLGRLLDTTSPRCLALAVSFCQSSSSQQVSRLLIGSRCSTAFVLRLVGRCCA